MSGGKKHGRKKQTSRGPRDAERGTDAAPSASSTVGADAAAASAARVSAPTPSGSQMPEASPTPVWARALVVALVLGTFAGSLDNPLLTTWDDQRFLFDPDVVSPSLAGLWRIFTEERYEAYHPLHLLSYWLDVPWAGPSGPVVHAVSALLWCGVLVLALDVLRRLGLGLGAALVATLAFGLHPVMVEPVAWASGRKDILAIGFSLGALLFHVRASHWNDRDAWVSRALFVCGALSKTSILTLPLALVLHDVWLERRSIKDAVLFQLPMLAVAATLGAVVIAVWRGHSMIRGDTGDVIGVEPLLVPATFTHHLHTIFWPAEVSPAYPTSRDLALGWGYALAGPLVLALGLGAPIAWLYREHARRGPGEVSVVFAQRFGLGVSWFVVLLLPVANILPMYFQWQDRYSAAPLFGLALALGALVETLRTASVRETWIRSAVTGAVLVTPLAARTFQYVEVWSSDRALWHHATVAQPRSYYAWIKLGEARRNEGAYDDALRAYGSAMELEPNTRLGYAAFLYVLGLRDERDQHLEGESHALSWSERYVPLADDAPALRDLAADLIDDGYHDAATFVLGRSLDLDPVGDDRLERAAAHHLTQGHEWLARFYVSRLSRRPVMPLVVSFYDAERLRMGLVTEEELLGDRAPPDPDANPDAPPLPGVEGSGWDTAIDLREE